MLLAFYSALKRGWHLSYPPEPTKSDGALKFGILGAAQIAPQAIILPAKSHPDVILQAVAARDKTKAETFAKVHGVQQVKESYQAILDDPEIDCVYVPQPTGLHLEWALRALKAGKHVLLEKPSVSNAAEAEILFRHPILQQPNAPILLEAVHYMFHPAWAAFMSYIDPPNVAKAWSALWAPFGIVGKDDIRFDFDLAGGMLLDCGAYTVAVLRDVFGAEAASCEECTTVPSQKDARCDAVFKARYRFPNGGYGEIEGSTQTWNVSPDIDVTHRPVVIDASEIGMEILPTQEITRIRRVFFRTFARPAHLHSIQVTDAFELKTRETESTQTGTSIKKWTTSKTVKAYTFREIGIEQAGEPYWQSYRYMLEQFVNKVRGRDVQQWVEADDSIKTAKMIDMAYEAANLPLRPTTQYR
ncbi:hypothetical protein BX600DRAFT_475818 [Xylariales sp. PMI_506]|nr:hypothetical protein BX600DRAFT_475818 [Xylariales sp. PMI_506]